MGSPAKLESPYTSGTVLLSLEVTDTKCNFQLASKTVTVSQLTVPDTHTTGVFL